MKSDLIDEFIISIVPVLLGNGTRLFKDGRPEQELELARKNKVEIPKNSFYNSITLKVGTKNVDVKFFV